ncbi:MAG: mobile mystery protein B [Candidatus Berkiella sp.]
MIIYPEGATPLDPDEIAGLKFKHITTREELDHLEQANIESGLKWLKNKKSVDVLSEVFIKELHKKLFGDVWKWAGMFRKSEKNIGIDPIHISTQLRMLIDDTHYWIEHKTFLPMEVAIRFHHKLVYIHLFPNGNGRHARIMADTLLVNRLGHKAIDWSGGYALSKMSERRKSYIAALKQADKGDYTALLNLIGIHAVN